MCSNRMLRSVIVGFWREIGCVRKIGWSGEKGCVRKIGWSGEIGFCKVINRMFMAIGCLCALGCLVGQDVWCDVMWTVDRICKYRI